MRAGGSSNLGARCTGLEVCTISGLCPDWAAEAGSSNANRQETNPRARQDKTMTRIELERRKFFSVENAFNVFRMLAGVHLRASYVRSRPWRLILAPANY